MVQPLLAIDKIEGAEFAQIVRKVLFFIRIIGYTTQICSGYIRRNKVYSNKLSRMWRVSM